MAYPDDPLPVIVEFWNGTSWIDITSKTFVRDGGISIRRGFPDEGSTPEPSECRLTLDNRTGDFSPRNPSGTYYGKIGRNTPIRVRVGGDVAGDGYLRIEGDDIQDNVSTPDNAALDITGDIDVRVDLALDSWASAGLAGKYTDLGGGGSDQRSWAFVVDANGSLSFGWSTDGTSGAVLSATSTVSAGLVGGQRKALRATMDVNDGGGNRVITFYTADTIDGPWSQLGAAVTDSGTTSIFSSSSRLEVGRLFAFPTNLSHGRVYAFQLRNGIDGTEVANPDFRDQEPGGTQDDPVVVVDDAGRTWQGSADVWLTNPRLRYVGEISEWPPRWDVSESDVWTSVTAQGILRRLGQGSRPARSPMKGAMLAHFPSYGLVGYWPMEEGDLATSFASALAGGAPLRYSGTRPDSGENGIGPILGSDRIAVLGSTTALTGSTTGTPITDDEFSLGCIMDVPTTTGWSDNTAIIHLDQDMTGSTVATWEVRYKSGSGGDLQVRALDESGSQLAASGTLDFNIDGQQLWLLFEVAQSGANAGWTVTTLTVDDDGVTVDTLTASGTFLSLTVNPPSRVRIAPSGGLSELAVGHVAVLSQDSLGTIPGHVGDVESAIVARAGETAAIRAGRLMDELGIVGRTIGTGLGPFRDDDESTVLMGPQATPSAFIDAFNETWAADMALAYETRDQLGLSWRTRASLYNQPVAATLDYDGAGEIAPDLTPIDDDQHVRNDITVKRKDGSSARAVDTTSRMGNQDPPDGVGLYEEQVEVNLYADSQLPAQAQWRLHLGTWDEARYPQVTIDMAALAAAGKTDLIAQVCALDVGDRIQLTNLPAFAGTPGTVDLMVLGFQEQIGHPTEWTVTLNCVPYGPYFVFEIGDQVYGRLDTSGSSLALGVDSDDTSLLVATDSGKAVWINSTDRPQDFPFAARMGGEVITVTGIDGTTSPQTFHVTRSVNGVTKSHDAGTDLRIAPVAVAS